jgi:hypothetical protein
MMRYGFYVLLASAALATAQTTSAAALTVGGVLDDGCGPQAS